MLSNKRKPIVFMVTCVLGLIAIVIVLAFIDDNNPKNWSPWFAFYRNKECVLQHNTYTNICFLVGTRSDNFPNNKNDTSLKNMYEIIDSLNLYGESTQSGEQKKRLDSTIWNCRFINTQKTADMLIYKPQRGDAFECWPQVPIRDDMQIQSVDKQSVVE